MKAFLARALATVGGLGDVFPAPGTTVGSLVGAVLYWAASILWPGSVTQVALVGLAVLLPASVWACGAEAERRGVAGCIAWNRSTSGRCTTGWPSMSRR